MHFINKQHRRTLELSRLVDCRADILNPGKDRGQGDKLGIGVLGNKPGNRGFTGSGWPPEDHRVQPVGLDRLAQWFTGSQ